MFNKIQSKILLNRLNEYKLEINQKPSHNKQSACLFVLILTNNTSFKKLCIFVGKVDLKREDY